MHPTGFTGMNIVGGAAADASPTIYAWNYWKPATYGPNCEAFVTLTSFGAGDLIRIGARVSGVGTSATTGYFVSVTPTAVWSIIRFDGGNDPVTLATGPTQSLASGDKIGIRIIGSVVTALLYAPSSGWTNILSYNTVADAHRYTTSGSFAMLFKASRVDDFGGGNHLGKRRAH